MNIVTSALTCRCLRAAPWKRSVKNLYPKQATGYEDNLEAQNAEELAKLALRNEKLFIPISKALEKNIYRDLRKQKYGYVLVGISAFITLVDMCHDNLFRFEATVYDVLTVLLREENPNVRIASMTLLIKVCQFKEQNDDAENGKYFDLLDYILVDFQTVLPSMKLTLHLRETAVNVLYQLVLICPAALITSKLPKLVPTLVDTIGMSDRTDAEEQTIIQNIRTISMKSLSNICPLVNVVTSSALLNPLFQSLDNYGWKPLSFSHAVLKSLMNTKSRESYAKPAYVHSMLHITQLLPIINNDENGIDNETQESASHPKESDMTSTSLNPRRLALVRNILSCVLLLIQETRSFSLLHVQQTVDILSLLYHYCLEAAHQVQCDLSKNEELTDLVDVRDYDEQMNETQLRVIIPQLKRVCRDCFVMIAKTVTGNREYFDVLENILYMIDECNEEYRTDLLELSQLIVNTKYLNINVSLPMDVIQIVSNGIMNDTDERRLLWYSLLTRLLYANATDVSSYRIQGMNQSIIISSVIHSLFIPSNTFSHYAAITTLFTTLLHGNIQDTLLTILPVMFYIQKYVILKSDTQAHEELITYLESLASVSPSLKDSLSNMTRKQSSMLVVMAPLDTVVEAEEEGDEESVASASSMNLVEANSEIALLPNEIDKINEEDIEMNQDEIELEEEEEESLSTMIHNPHGSLYAIFTVVMNVMKEIATLVHSDDLTDYLNQIELKQTEEKWCLDDENHVCDGKLVFIQKETVIQYIVRSPLILSSSVPTGYVDDLRKAYEPEEIEEVIPQEAGPHLLHRLSSVSNGSELSFRNSTRDSDSDISELLRGEESENIAGSKYLRVNPLATFDEMMEKAKNKREEFLESMKDLEREDTPLLKAERAPGSQNNSVTLMM